jgi:hypothetical protein
MHLPWPPHQINSVRDFRHEPFGEAEASVAVFIVHDCADRVAARIGGVVQGALVVHRRELKMGIRLNLLE